MNKAILVCLIFLGMVNADDRPSDAADKIGISVSSIDTAFMTAGVALKRGFLKEEGVDPEIIRMNANVSITAPAQAEFGIKIR